MMFLLLALGFPSTDVFVGGEGGYPAYRIPAAIVTRQGTILAYAEGRSDLADHAKNDLVLRRSEDGGKTFSPIVTLRDAGDDALNNPCAVEIVSGQHSGRVLLSYQRYPEGKGEYQVVTGLEGDSICRSFVIHSDDDGRNWSDPIEITGEVKDEIATSLASGPGVGFQKRREPHQGRVVIPFNRGPAPDWRVFAAFSDDGGETWKRGAIAPGSEDTGVANEVQMVELGDGSILLNARGMSGAKRRKVARSDDGGVTWTPLVDDPALLEPRVMASLIRIPSGVGDSQAGRVLYCGPRSENARVDGHLWISEDEGRTWGDPILVAEGFFAYSSLAPLPSGRVGVLFEADDSRRIVWREIDLPSR